MSTRLYLSIGEANKLLKTCREAIDAGRSIDEWFIETYGRLLLCETPTSTWFVEVESDEHAIEFKLRYL